MFSRCKFRQFKTIFNFQLFKLRMLDIKNSSHAICNIFYDTTLFIFDQNLVLNHSLAAPKISYVSKKSQNSVNSRQKHLDGIVPPINIK